MKKKKLSLASLMIQRNYYERNTEIISKVNKIGKAGLIITRICQVCLWIGVVACILSGIVLSFIPDDMIHTENQSIVQSDSGVDHVLNNAFPQDKEQLAADPLEALIKIAAFVWLMRFRFRLL